MLFLERGRHFRRGITQNKSGENFTLRMVNDWIRRGQADSNQKKFQVYNIFLCINYIAKKHVTLS